MLYAGSAEGSLLHESTVHGTTGVPVVEGTTEAAAVKELAAAAAFECAADAAGLVFETEAFKTIQSNRWFVSSPTVVNSTVRRVWTKGMCLASSALNLSLNRSQGLF